MVYEESDSSAIHTIPMTVYNDDESDGMSMCDDTIPMTVYNDDESDGMSMCDDTIPMTVYDDESDDPSMSVPDERTEAKTPDVQVQPPTRVNCSFSNDGMYIYIHKILLKF